MQHSLSRWLNTSLPHVFTYLQLDSSTINAGELMKIEISSATPDGVNVMFTEPFFFFTKKDAYAFIDEVEKAEIKIDKKSKKRRKKLYEIKPEQFKEVIGK